MPESDPLRPNQEPSPSRVRAAITLLLVALVVAPLAWDSLRIREVWEFGSPLRVGDDFSALLAAKGDVAYNLQIGLAVREISSEDSLQAVVFPNDLDLLRPKIEWHGREFQMVKTNVVDELVWDRVTAADYDPVLSSSEVVALSARADIAKREPGVRYFTEAGADEGVFVVFTDPDRTLFFVVPSSLSPAGDPR